MDEIRDYMQQPASQRLYSEGMRLFTQYALPHPQFAPHFSTLSAGPRGNNVQKLEECLKGCLRLAPPTPVKAVVVETKPAKPSLAVKSLDQVEMLVEIRKLRIQRSKAAQSFHDHDTDEGRARVCDRIDELEKAIKDLDGKLAYYQRYGKLPPPPLKAAPLPLPEDKAGLARELNLVNNRIRYIERQINHFSTLPEHDKRRSEMPEKQEKLAYYASRKITVKQKLYQLANKERLGRYE